MGAVTTVSGRPLADGGAVLGERGVEAAPVVGLGLDEGDGDGGVFAHIWIIDLLVCL